MTTYRLGVWLLATAGLLAALPLAAQAPAAAVPAVPAPATVPHGRFEIVAGVKVLSLDGTPEEMGTACAQLIGPLVQRVVGAVVTAQMAGNADRYRQYLARSEVMAKFQPAEYRRELRALALGTGIKYEDLLLLQYIGDIGRATLPRGQDAYCTSFAVLPPNTAATACIVGRNFDYFDWGIADAASLVVWYRPTGKLPFITITWAGIINGWTLLNAKGIVVSNNTGFGGAPASLEGISTCFMLRHVVEQADTVARGIELVRQGPRACGTSMLIAQGNPPDAVIVEFDHTQVQVRRAAEGFVGADNSFLLIGAEEGTIHEEAGRLEFVHDLVRAQRGKITVETNLAGTDGVPIHMMNLHSVTIDATTGRLRVALGRIPAYTLPRHALRLTPEGVVAD